MFFLLKRGNVLLCPPLPIYIYIYILVYLYTCAYKQIYARSLNRQPTPGTTNAALPDLAFTPLCCVSLVLFLLFLFRPLISCLFCRFFFFFGFGFIFLYLQLSPSLCSHPHLFPLCGTTRLMVTVMMISLPCRSLATDSP